MKSLRTDDIIGASPRVRHMPKNLLRQHRYYPYQNINNFQAQKDYQNYYHNLGGKWDHSYNQNMYGNFPLSQYDPNPFIKQPTLNKYQANNSQINMPNQPNKKSPQLNHYEQYNASKSYKFDEYRKNEPQNPIQNREIKKKQALIINYDQIKELQRMRNAQKGNQKYFEQISNRKQQNLERGYINGPGYQKGQNQNQMKSRNDGNYLSQNQLTSIPLVRSSVQNPLIPSSQARLRSSSSLNKSTQKQKQKNIFRGLGFNIITNSKQEYQLETNHPYIKRQNMYE